MLAAALAAPLAVAAADDGHGHAAHAHGSESYWYFQMDSSIGQTNGNDDFSDSKYEGWYGNDEHKLYFQGELQRHDNSTERSEYWFLYSRRISEFWDLQTGIRHDSQPSTRGHAALGIKGHAPFFVETALYAVFGHSGAINIRLHQSREFLLTQRLVLLPHLELNFHNKDIPNREISYGFGETEIGLKLYYKLTSKLAPYVDIRYQHEPPFDRNDIDEDYSFMRFMLGVQVTL